MKELDQVEVVLHDSASWRLKEIEELRRLCVDSHDVNRNVLHRSLVLFLYAHLEGFTKDALQAYLSFVASQNICCEDALPVLGTFALRDEFRQFYDVTSGLGSLPKVLRDDKEIRRHAVEANFISRSVNVHKTSIRFSADFINTEDNIDETVLRKNLFRLGLDHTKFKSQAAAFGQLKNLRNAISHGRVDRLADPSEIDKKIELVRSAINDLIHLIVSAIQKQLYRRGSESDFFAAKEQSTIGNPDDSIK